MLVRLEALDRRPFDQYGAGRHRDVSARSRQHEMPSIHGALFQGTGKKDHKSPSPHRGLYTQNLEPQPLTAHARGSSSPPEPESGPKPRATPERRPQLRRDSLTPTPQLATRVLATPGPAGSVPACAFLRIPASEVRPFSFPACHATRLLGPSIKRSRPLSDVDGPHTASLPSKKRRLGKQLITSMLSQPYSQPATHIINREGASSGDKRFLKLAAVSAARRLNGLSAMHNHHNHPGHHTFLRRAAVVNRFRLRVRDEAVEKGHIKVADIAAGAALLQPGHGVGLAVGARFPAVVPHQPFPGLIVLGPRSAHLGPRHAVTKAAGETGSSPSDRSLTSSFVGTQSHPRPPSSPRLRPQLPEPRTTQPEFDPEADEIDDGEASFPYSEHDSRYDSSDDPEDVYADFEAIFCGTNSDADSSDDEGENYENAMDDLDGIPWKAR